jgi:hypothetical protein
VCGILLKQNTIVNLNIRKFIVGKMSALALDIEESLCAGDNIGDIAIRFGVTVNDVLNIKEHMMDSIDDYNDSMDGDFDSAMASAGYGTDEDYGCYTGEY